MKKKLSIALILVIAALIGFLYYHWEEVRNHDHLILYGNVDVRQVDLGFRVSGRVTEMLFEEGDLVQPGMLIGILDKRPYTDQVRQAQASVDALIVSVANAEIQLQRRQELIDTGSVSKEDLDNALSNRDVLQAQLKEAKAALGVAITNLCDTEVYAPTKGTILTRIREPGTVVKAADPIYTLSILSPVWVRAFVSEPELGLIYPGMSAMVTTDTPGNKIYEGHIGFISPVAEFTPKTVETTKLRTDLVYRLRVIVDNPDEGLKQGMPVTIKLERKK